MDKSIEPQAWLHFVPMRYAELLLYVIQSYYFNDSWILTYVVLGP
jgi:hypothetical protein